MKAVTHSQHYFALLHSIEVVFTGPNAQNVVIKSFKPHCLLCALLLSASHKFAAFVKITHDFIAIAPITSQSKMLRAGANC